MGWVQGPGTRAEVGVMVGLVSLGTIRRVDGQRGRLGLRRELWSA